MQVSIAASLQQLLLAKCSSIVKQLTFNHLPIARTQSIPSWTRALPITCCGCTAMCDQDRKESRFHWTPLLAMMQQRATRTALGECACS